jgi:murein DD-endopeptidase MepM/ murein hydrolase activator NlpD
MTQEYFVKKGDTLWGIARHFSKNVSQLAEWNSLSGRQVHDLKIGQQILLRSQNEEDVPDLILTIHLLDLSFNTINKATIRCEYDGQPHIIHTTDGIFTRIKINDHSKGLKVYFKNIKGHFDLIAVHKMLPYGGHKTLTLTSRMVKVSGSYAAEKGTQQKSINTIQRELKNQHQPLLSASVPTPAPSQKSVPQTSLTPSDTKNKTPSAPSIAGTTPIDQTIRTDGGNHTHVVAVQFTEDNLFLSNGNLLFRAYIINAAIAHGFAPQALAALVDAEASKIGKKPNQHWNPNSQSSSTSAGGLTQFLDGAWLEMCKNGKSLVCIYIKSHSKMSENTQMGLKFNPEFAIDAAAVYAEDNIAQLGKKPYNLPIDKVTDPAEKAKLAYLTHHEGAKGAYRVIMDLDDDESAQKRLAKQLNNKKNPNAASKYIKRFKNAKTAYAVWLRTYVDNKICLEHFTTIPKDGEHFAAEKSLNDVIIVLGGKSYASEKPAPKNTQPAATSSSSQPNQTGTSPSVPLSAGAGGANSWHDPLAHCVLRTAGLASARAATFGMVRNNGHRAHQGVDLAANPGTTIYAVASGTVAAVNPNDVGDYGKHIIIEVNPDDLPASKRLYAVNTKDINDDDIEHENHRIYFFYAHLSEIIDTNVGNNIDAGQSLGKTGDTGNASGMTEISKGAHLHFEARLIANTHRGLQQRIDPIPFINANLSY